MTSGYRNGFQAISNTILGSIVIKPSVKVDNNYQHCPRHKLLFFSRKVTDDTYHVTYSYQGLFVMKDGIWQNQALEYIRRCGMMR